MVSRRYLCCNSLIDVLEGIKESINYLDQILFEAWTFDGTRITVIDEKKKD